MAEGLKCIMIIVPNIPFITCANCKLEFARNVLVFVWRDSRFDRLCVHCYKCRYIVTYIMPILLLYLHLYWILGSWMPKQKSTKDECHFDNIVLLLFKRGSKWTRQVCADFSAGLTRWGPVLRNSNLKNIITKK